jgi:2EXR family
MDTPSFSLFSALTVELRIKIWSYAINSEPRVLILRYLPESDCCVCSTPVPSLLHVNRESRYEALRVYKLVFGTSTKEPQTYFAPNLDTVYLPRYRDMGYDETLRDFRSYLRWPEECDIVRWLGLDFVESDIKRPWETYDKAILIKSFPKLEMLFVVFESRKEKELQARQCEREIMFVKPKVGKKEIWRVLTQFRTDLNRELTVMDQLSRDWGNEVKSWTLPNVKVVARTPVAKKVRSENAMKN